MVSLLNPGITYDLPCTWNLQMYEGVNPEMCLSTWNRPVSSGYEEPHLLHADMVDKREKEFSLKGSYKLAKTGTSNFFEQIQQFHEFEDFSSFWYAAKDVADRYIVVRSQYHAMNGYELRHNPMQSSGLSLLDVSPITLYCSIKLTTSTTKSL